MIDTIELLSRLELHAQQRPNKTALKTLREEFTYLKLWEKVGIICKVINQSYIPKGQPLACLSSDPLEQVCMLLASLKSKIPFFLVSEADFEKGTINQCDFNILTSKKTSLSSIEFEIIKCEKYFIDSNKEWIGDNKTSLEGQLSYGFCTSGTTGGPIKIALHTMHSLNTFLNWAVDKFEFDFATHSIQLSPVQFDIYLFNVLPVLQAGGRVYFPEKSEYLFAGDFFGVLQNEKISFLQVTPSFWTHILRADLKHIPLLRELNQIFSTGEMLSSFNFKQLKKIFPQTKIYHFYGQTELNTYCYNEFGDIDVNRGIPIDNGQHLNEVLILDENNKEVQKNVIGEMAVSGPTVLKHYLASGKERDPKIKIGNRFYFKTGDYGRINDSRHIELFGRKDSLIQEKGRNPISLLSVSYCLEYQFGLKKCYAWRELESIYFYYQADFDAKLMILKYLENLGLDQFQLKVKRVKSFPLNTNGKLDRTQLFN